MICHLCEESTACPVHEPKMYRCKSVNVKGMRCEKTVGHDGAHQAETPLLVVAWGWE